MKSYRERLVDLERAQGNLTSAVDLSINILLEGIDDDDE